MDNKREKNIYYFVDFENVNKSGLDGIENMPKNSIIYVLYSENCKNIPMEVVDKLTNSQAETKFISVAVGNKNALDFQLSTLLGYIVGKENTEKQQKNHYVIVSKDTGYKAVVSFWKQRNENIMQTSSLSESIVCTPIGKKNNTSTGIITMEDVKKYIPVEYCTEQLVSKVNKCKNKNQLHNEICKLITPQSKASKVYRQIKPLFNEKKGK